MVINSKKCISIRLTRANNDFILIRQVSLVAVRANKNKCTLCVCANLSKSVL